MLSSRLLLIHSRARAKNNFKNQKADSQEFYLACLLFIALCDFTQVFNFISEKQQPAYCDRHGKRNDQIDDRRKLIADSCNEGGVKEVKELPQGKKQY